MRGRRPFGSFGAFGSFGMFGTFGSFGAFGAFGSFGMFGPCGPFARRGPFDSSCLAALVVVLLAAPAFAQTETIAEIRVHGNHTTPDADILSLAGLSTGQPFTDAQLAEAERRLRVSKRFEGVEVLKRYRSIANPNEILVMLVVDEHPAVGDGNLMPGPLSKLRAAGMWMPILSHADGYGFTYGARTTLVEAFGKQTRLSVPLTWGGERKAALEIERTFAGGPLDLVRGTVSATRRVNPFYGEADRRFEARIRGERAITTWLRAGAGARATDNAFGIADDRTRAIGADLIVDTRLDPSFPRNALYASTGLERMSFDVGAPGGKPVAVRWTTDLRGYIGVGGSTVLALRAATSQSRTPLPLFEQSMLGGSGSLRGYRTGHRAGDNIATLSAELRYPLSSPLAQSRLGLKAFIDGGTAWATGRRLRDQPFERGIGGGVYFGGGPVILDLDVAWPETGKPRAHFGLGVTF